MLKRLLNLWRRDGAAQDEGVPRPLCRLRHATLHPGSALWTPGVGGGNLGGGASNALDDVGVGAEVVVGFQAGAREPVHAQGVIARIEDRVPFPDSWNPEGLGATHRYRLVGLARVAIDPASTTNKRVPTVLATLAPERPEDLVPAPPELVELLEALARLDNAWPDHWLEAFRTLPGAALGQWATTLGWRLSREERLDLFEHPGRIAEVLSLTLDALHLGLAPERRREAVRVQTLTRRTSYLPERCLDVVSDEDGWALFHPSDLASLGEGGGLHDDAARGNVVTWKAPPGHRYRVRFTARSLEAEEEARRREEGAFHLLVRHGRLFLGGGTLVRAGSYQERFELADPQQWIDAPNGVYQVFVVALNRPQVAALRDDESDTEPGEGAEPQAMDRGVPAVAVDFVVRLVPKEISEDHARETQPIILPSGA